MTVVVARIVVVNQLVGWDNGRVGILRLGEVGTFFSGPMPVPVKLDHSRKGIGHEFQTGWKVQ
jgi:hypothetical protein